MSSWIRRIKSTPDPDTFEEYCDTPPISIAIEAVLAQVVNEGR